MRGERGFIMSAFFRLATISVLTMATSVVAQVERRGTLEQLRVKHQDLPVFPLEMVRMGARDGKVIVALSVDAAGRIEDCLAVAYTHPDFAQATLAALRRWTFEPAMLNGTPV